MELRKDYILDRWVIIASGRGRRPQELREPDSSGKDLCFFCPGNEHLTPAEIGRIGNRKWRFRWFANKFPAVDILGNPDVRTDNTFFTFADAFGMHEIIVETPSKKKQLWDLGSAELAELFSIYKGRIAELSGRRSINYVAIFKNHGSKGGASLQHSHTQIIATAFIPQIVQQEADASGKPCRYCKIIDIEKGSFRRCFENADAVAFAPYASRFNYEVWLFPKRHVTSLADLTKEELSSLAKILLSILRKLKKLNAAYNYFLHYSPAGSDLHFHVEVTPRIANWAGFELSSGITINTVSPEDAARFYRGESEF
ncbi:DUF4931 domain-containing protein [Candidatus Woesearchaeota archaeon]|nr:DUF4931 domain-containing protein [Candidatus Woesearchaeota archaeon]